MKDYRYLGEIAEVLGTRMDAARNALSNAKSEWAKNYWKQTLDRLNFQWCQLPILHDADAKMTIIPKWTIDYDFFEVGHVNEGFGLTDRVFYKVFKENADLEQSWNLYQLDRKSVV